ncbi:MAG TPA: glycine betaine ABC transporter substrate-binding protein, partial [Rubrobacter sp.]|nr:glycine betaine ABC transporter substrate-binding protein [Rubrobacter sp.]
MTGERVKNKNRLIRAVTAMLVAALVFVAAACGGGGGGGGGSSSDGPSVSVGSKKFTEQILLGEMYAQAFEDEGYNVERKLNLGSEQVMDKSLQDGTIDVYPEYTGTAYVAILKKPPESYPKAADETYKQVAEFYKNRKDTPMQMLEPAPFNNSYGICMLTEEADKLGIETLDDLAEK